MWLMRGGIVLAMGAFGTLGWISYRQMPNTAAASEEPAQQTLVLDGDMAEQPAKLFARDVVEPAPASPTTRAEIDEFRQHAHHVRGTSVNPFATGEAQPVQTVDASTELSASRFESPTPSRRQGSVERALPEPNRSGAPNPFAEFAATRPGPAETTTELSFDAKSAHHKSNHRPHDVTLASNEAHPEKEIPAATVEVIGQSEPGTVDLQTAQSEPTAPAETQHPAAASDPFAAFATQPAEAASPAPSTVPGSFGRAAQTEPAAQDAWTAAPSAPVTPVQFQSEPAPLAPGGFEAQAKPIDTGSPFEAQQSPALSRPAAAADWPAGEHQPAAVEPMNPRRGKTKPTYSPGIERVSSNGGFNVPQPVTPANDPRDEKLHVVQQGETWWSIARQHYGAGRYFQALAEYNKPRISDQQQLKPGMKVLVPSANTLEVRYDKQMQASGLARPAAKPKSGLQFNAQGQPFYVVGEGDTLGEIATRYLGKTLRSDEIFRLNQEQLPTPNSLKVGMILVMPVDASESQPASSVPRGR